MPEDQLANPDRRAALGIPADVVFKTKPHLAQDILADMVADATMPPWAAGDEVYGRSSKLRTFFGITMPLALPGVISTALLAFIFAWNEFLFANVLTGASTRTAPVSLTEYVNPVSIEWNNIMAAGTLVVLPVWIFALAVQRRGDQARAAQHVGSAKLCP